MEENEQEVKTSEKQTLREVELSTTVPCKKCAQPNTVNEIVFIDDADGSVYHKRCVSSGEKAETFEQDKPSPESYKVHELTITDGVPVKSESK